MFVSADIVIIGGGITGLSTAYFLAQKGQAQVVLLEKDLLAQASTGLCVGGIRQQFTHPANILLSQETIRFLEKFKKDSQTDIGFHQVGYLFLAQKQKTWEDFLDSVPIQRAYNVPVEVLSPGEIKERWPYLRVDDLMGGTFGPDDGYVDPYQLAMALANRARDSGALILENTEVKEILIRQNRVEGVETTQGTVSAQKVVNAAGAWGRKIAQMAGIDLPVRPFRRQVFATKPFDAAPQPVPMVIDQDTLSYFRGDGPGLLLGMSDPSEPPSFFTHVDRSFLEKVIVHAVHRAPILGKAKILRGWGGLYAITPDENPIIGEIPEVKGFVCATGFSGHGFQHGPSVGRILSELLLKGDTQFDLSPFAPDRFKKRKKTTEKRTV